MDKNRNVLHEAPRNIFQYDAFSRGLARTKKMIASFEKKNTEK